MKSTFGRGSTCKRTLQRSSVLGSMSGSTIARVLVALCIGSAVNCMPKGTHKSRRQAQQHHVSSVSQGKFCSSPAFQTFKLPALCPVTLWTSRALDLLYFCAILDKQLSKKKKRAMRLFESSKTLALAYTRAVYLFGFLIPQHIKVLIN